MLHNRIQLLKSYLTNLPPSYLTISSQPGEPSEPQASNYTEINHPILRSVQALLNRLPLLLPADQTIFEQEILAEKSNVSLVDLLATATSAIKDARELGRKFSIVESMRQASTKRHAPGLMADDLSMYQLDKADAPFPALG